MPIPPANPAIIRAELTDDELASMGQFCVLAGVHSADWHFVPALREYFETLAALRMIQKGLASGATKEDSRNAAALQLGIGADTLRTRLERLRGARARHVKRNRQIVGGTTGAHRLSSVK